MCPRDPLDHVCQSPATQCLDFTQYPFNEAFEATRRE
jgi:hypothetical protein